MDADAIRALASLHGDYDGYRAWSPSNVLTFAAWLREEAARREGKAKQEPFRPCPECINPGTCERIGCYQATNTSAATPPAADAATKAERKIIQAALDWVDEKILDHELHAIVEDAREKRSAK